jgi:hypothetical protein
MHFVVLLHSVEISLAISQNTFIRPHGLTHMHTRTTQSLGVRRDLCRGVSCTLTTEYTCTCPGLMQEKDYYYYSNLGLLRQMKPITEPF